MGDEAKADVEPDQTDYEVEPEAGFKLRLAGAVAGQGGDDVIALGAKHDAKTCIDWVDTVSE